jgi:hypothetical protein
VDRGYIKLHRRIRDNWLWSKPYSLAQAWLDIVMMAEWKPRAIQFGGETTTIERGQVQLSARFLAERFGWGKTKANAFLRRIVHEQMMIKNADGKADSHGTLYTIVNYDTYNPVTSTGPDTSADSERTASGQQADKTNKTRSQETYSRAFLDWWKRYPLKVGKLSAAKAYKAALKRTDSDTLLAGVARYNAEIKAKGTEERYIAHATTWLNQGRWDDEFKGADTTQPAFGEWR